MRGFSGWLGVIAMCIGLCALAHPVQAQSVFLCKDAQGRPHYQDTACAQTTEVETEWTKKRAREQAQQAKLEAERIKNEKVRREAETNRPIYLRDCVKDKDCTIETIRMRMYGISQAKLMEALGPPDNVQSGGNEYWYYTVTGEMAGARRRVRLQLEFMYGENPVTGRSEKVVMKVNTY